MHHMDEEEEEEEEEEEGEFICVLMIPPHASLGLDNMHRMPH